MRIHSVLWQHTSYEILLLLLYMANGIVVGYMHFPLSLFELIFRRCTRKRYEYIYTYFLFFGIFKQRPCVLKISFDCRWQRTGMECYSICAMNAVEHKIFI